MRGCRFLLVAIAASSPVLSLPATSAEWTLFPIDGGGYVMGVAISPSEPNRWYSFADVGGPYRSDDSGANWRPLHQAFSVADRAVRADRLRGFSVDPRNADSFVAVGGNYENRDGGAYVSRDGGRSLTKTLNARFMGNGPRRVHGLGLDRNPFDPDELVCGDEMDGIFVSNDSGMSWRCIGLKGFRFTDVRYDRTKKGRIYASAPRLKKTGGASSFGFFATDDYGREWVCLSEDAPCEICQISGGDSLVSLRCPDNVPPEPEKAVCISHDGGRSWSPFCAGLPKEIYRAITAGRDFFLLSDRWGRMYRRGVSDAAWSRVKCDSFRLAHPDRQERMLRLEVDKRMEYVSSLAIDANDESHWLATDWYFVWESRDGGLNWTTRSRGMMQLVSWCLSFDPFDPEKICYGVADMQYYCSTNGGRAFFCPKGFNPYATSLSHSRRTPGLVVGVGGKDVTPIAVSKDGGITFSRTLSKGLPKLQGPTNAAYSVAIDPLTDDFFLAVAGPCGIGNGGIYRSQDCGASWSNFSSGLPYGRRLFKEREWWHADASQIVFSGDGSAIVRCPADQTMFRLDRDKGAWVKINVEYSRYPIVADPFVPGRFLMPGSKLLETLDGGVTFHEFAPGLANCSGIAFDQRIRGLVVFGCFEGLYVSTNGGKTVRLLSGGLDLPSGDSRSVAVDGGRMYFMTSGSGVFTRDLCLDLDEKITPFKEGEKVAFYGDSISQNGFHVFQLQLLWNLMHPGSHVRIENRGCSGESAGKGCDRWAWDGRQEHYDRVFVMYGMNDVKRQIWKTKSPKDGAEAKLRKRVILDYKLNLQTLVRRIMADGAGVVLLTPTPYWVYQTSGGEPLLGVNDALTQCASVVRQVSRELGTELVDLHSPMTAFMRGHPDVCLAPDRVHPQEAASLLVTSRILKAMGEDGSSARLTFDMSGSKRISRIVTPAVPFPDAPEYSLMRGLCPYLDLLMRRKLVVDGVPEGFYRVRAAGKLVGICSAEELRTGVNIPDVVGDRQMRSAYENAKQLRSLVEGLRSVVLNWGYAHEAGVRRGDLTAFNMWIEKELEKAERMPSAPWWKMNLLRIRAWAPVFSEKITQAENLYRSLNDVVPHPIAIEIEGL